MHHHASHNPESIGVLQSKYDLHNAPEVKIRADGLPNTPEATVGDYLGGLASHHSLFNRDVPNAEIRRQRQIQHYVIPEADVPEAYFDNLKRIARERGLGDIEITQEERDRHIDILRDNQYNSLESWADYLSSDDAPFPAWFKYYAYRSVTNLSSLDKEKHEFRKRSRGTTAAFPELNPEALAYVYDAFVVSGQRDHIDDEKTARLVKGANFSKLYAHALEKAVNVSPEHSNQAAGSWTKYPRTNNLEVARELSGSLEGKGTSWCTAGIATAKEQLSMGDFYIYYSADKTGQDTIPRAAIRMEEGWVSEVRGIALSQGMEPEMLDIVKDKLLNLPGGEDYQRQVEDMKRLTELDKQLAADPEKELSNEEISFLFELGHSIRGFQQPHRGRDSRDPRIAELRRKVAGPRVKAALIALEAPTTLYIDPMEDQGRMKRLSMQLESSPSADLSVNDIRFLYELDANIKTFDAFSDDQAEKLRSTRDLLADMQKVSGKTDQEEIARWLLEDTNRGDSALLEGIGFQKFTHLDKSIAHELISSSRLPWQYLRPLAENTDIFSGLTHEELAQTMLADNVKRGTLAAELYSFKDLSAEVAEALTLDYPLYVYVNLEAFPSLHEMGGDDSRLGLSRNDRKALRRLRGYEAGLGEDEGRLDPQEIHALEVDNGHYETTEMDRAVRRYIEALIKFERSPQKPRSLGKQALALLRK